MKMRPFTRKELAIMDEEFQRRVIFTRKLAERCPDCDGDNYCGDADHMPFE